MFAMNIGGGNDMEATMSKQELRALYMRKYEENKDAVDRRIADGIETYRKGDCRIRFTDEAGNPLSGVKVKITQTSHDFKYGANLFLLDELESAEANAEYRRFFKEYFNLATIPFYWKISLVLQALVRLLAKWSMRGR